MRYFVKGTDGNGRVFYVQLVSEITFPEILTAHREKAWEFDTMAGADIGEACRMATRLYGFQFYPEALAPQMGRDDFFHHQLFTEACALVAWLDRMSACMGGHVNALRELVTCCEQTLRSLPAFRNQDTLNDYSIRLGYAVLQRVKLAEAGIYHLNAQRTA